MNEYCLFNSKKLCDDCGECDICDLDSNKKCSNCGKCLNLDEAETRAINIDAIDEEEVGEGDTLLESEAITDNEEVRSDAMLQLEDSEEYTENTEAWELIDDIDGLNELLEDQKYKKKINEVFPGLISINKNNLGK